MNRVLDQVRGRMVCRSRERKRDLELQATVSTKTQSEGQYDLLGNRVLCG